MHQVTYRPEIDGLRAIAVGLVVIFHAFPGAMPGGYIGVDVFFVISGFLITSIISREMANGSFSLIRFYERRCRRILPAYLLTMFTVAVFAVLTFWPSELRQLGENLSASAAFLANIRLWLDAGYFTVEADFQPLLHLWSLAVEEQFYLFWPVLLLVAPAFRMRPLLVALTLLFLSLGLSGFLTSSYKVASFYLLPTRAWELMMGAVLALGQASSSLPLKKVRRLVDSPAYANGLSSLCLGVILGCAFLFDKTTDFPGVMALLPTSATVGLMALGQKGWVGRALLSHRLMIAVGLISYPLYLWHWPFLSFNRIYMIRHPGVWMQICSIALAVGCSWLTYRFVEQPIRSGGFGMRSRVRVFSTSALGLSLVAALGIMFVVRTPWFVSPSEVPSILKDIGWNDYFRLHQQHQASLDPTPTSTNEALSDIDLSILFVGDSKAMTLVTGLIDKPSRYQASWGIVGKVGCSLSHWDEDDCGDFFKELARGETSKFVVFALRSDELSDAFSMKYLRWVLKGLDQQAKVRPVIFVDIPTLPFVPQSCVPRRLDLPWVVPDCVFQKSEHLNDRRHYQQQIGLLKSEFPKLAAYDPTPLLCPEDVCLWRRGERALYLDPEHLSTVGSRLVLDDFIPWLKRQTLKDVASRGRESASD